MIPGPRGYPIFGSMRLMRGLAHRHLDAVATRLAARRLMAFSLGGTRVIVTAHPNVDKHLHNRYAGAKEIDTREREGGRERDGGREAGRGGRREREGGREGGRRLTVPTGLNLSPCQRLG